MQNREMLWSGEKMVSFSSNAIFLFSWSLICFHLVRRWHMIGGTLRVDGISMLGLFGILWLSLLREKASRWCLFSASFAFASLLDIVTRAL
jgi:hypothetical protein